MKDYNDNLLKKYRSFQAPREARELSPSENDTLLDYFQEQAQLAARSPRRTVHNKALETMTAQAQWPK